MNYALWAKVTHTAFLIFLSYFLILIAYYLFLGISGLIEGKLWARKRDAEDYALSYFTTFAIPVTIIVPAHNEELWIADCVKSIVNLNYPKFELIVVDDGSTDKTFEILNDIFSFKPVDMVYIKHYKDGKVFDISRSEKYPFVTIIRKPEGFKKAGAVNAGLNIAGYDYVCVVDGDTVLEQDSILKVMAQVQKDPDRIAGIGSYFGLSNGFKIKNGAILERRFSYRPIIAYQNLEYLRSFFGNRLSWSAFNALPIIAGGFGVWRKDVLYELGGYSSEFTCEDLPLTFSAHKYIADNKKDYRITTLPYYVSWTDGPSNLISLIKQRERWQRVVIEAVWKYKSMFLNPKYGSFAFFSFPYFLLYEVLGVFFEITSLAFVLSGWWLGILDLSAFLAFITLMIASQAIYSLLSILSFVRTQRLFQTRYVVYLIFLSFTEFLFYRWIISIAKVYGTLNYNRGIREYTQYVRGKRD